MVLGIILYDTPDFLGHTFSQKTKLDTISMMIRPGTFFNGNVLCTHLFISFKFLIYISAKDTCSYYDTGFNVCFLVDPYHIHQTLDQCSSLCVSYDFFGTKLYVPIDPDTKSDLVYKYDVMCQVGVLVAV